MAPIVLGLAVIGAAGWWVTNSPLFDMHRLEVSGNSHLSDNEVARLARLSRTTNVVWLKNKTVAGRIERDPWVLRARVSRTLPGTVSVSIHERKAVAALEGRGRSVAVAADGMILGPVSAKARLPVIELPGAPTVLGSRIAGMPPQLLVARALPASLRRRVARIIQAGSSLTLILRDGVTVRYGDASEAGAKARALVSLLEWAHDRGIRPDYIDVQAPAAPALLPRSAATSG